MSIKIFLIGLPGCGKTTLVKNILQKINPVRGGASNGATGFYTEEIREAGTRTGFIIKTLDNKEAVLAGISIKSKYKVGKYNVNIEGIEGVATPSIQTDLPDQLIVIDEIGKMECLSEKFRETIINALDSPNPVLATLPQKGTPFIESLKTRKDIFKFYVTPNNRTEVLQETVSILNRGL